MIIEKEKLVDDMIRRLENKTLSVFAGAGLSRGNGGMGWAELCRLCTGSEPECDPDEYPEALQSYVEENGIGPSEFKSGVAGRFESLTPGRKQEILARLPIRNYWTTNFDDLIEKGIELVDSAPAVMKADEDFVDMERRRDKIVYKLHGDACSPDGMVILEDDYKKYREGHGNFVLALEHELTTQSMLFLGYGMNDPDVDSIIKIVNFVYNVEAPHYMILCRKNVDDDTLRVKIKYLEKNGIENICLISDFAEVDDILESIYRKFMARKVFVSGSAYDAPGGFGVYQEKDDAVEMLKSLGYKLTERFREEEEFNLISGYGLEFGPYVMDGAAQAIAEYEMDFGKRLLIYPFPNKYYSVPDSERGFDLNEEYRKYREKMIARCGVVFFFIGKKYDTVSHMVVDASGVEKEFEIAKSQKKYVFPIATGGMSDTLAKDVMEHYRDYNYDSPKEVEDIYMELNRRLLSDASSVSSDEIIGDVCRIVELLAYS